MQQLVSAFQAILQAEAQKDKARWLEQYVKHNIQSRGVGIPIIREKLRRFEKERKLTALPQAHQIEWLEALFASPYSEDKLTAILYLQLFWKCAYPEATLDLIERIFERGQIGDWNVCDWLCVRVLTPLLDEVPRQTPVRLKNWNRAANQWQARASLVPFAQAKSLEKYPGLILSFSIRLIQRPERFCKTAVGWVLRSYSKIDPAFVQDFLKQQSEWTTAEVRKNALKYLKK